MTVKVGTWRSPVVSSSVLSPALAGVILGVGVMWMSMQAGFSRPGAVAQGPFTAKLNGVELWYLVSGKGPVCIMPSTGWGPGTDMYFRAFAPLEDVFTMVYLDSRGTGRSQKPPSTQDYTYDDLVADIDALRHHLDLDQVWLMGQSEGGVQIQQYAVAHPKRVSGLILLATLPASDREWVEDVHQGIARHAGKPYYEAGAETMKSMFAADENGWKGFEIGESFGSQWQLVTPFYFSDFDRFQKVAPELNARAAHSDIPPPKEAFSLDALKGTIDSKRHPFNLIERLKGLETPALVIAGADDIICSPSTARRLHHALTSSELLIIEDAGHFPWMEQPDSFFSAVKNALPRIGY